MRNIAGASTASNTRSTLSEITVLQYLAYQNWHPIYHDIKIFGVQIDLLLRDPEGILTIVEVKSGSSLAHIGPSQIRRLFRVADFLGDWEPVNMVAAFLEQGNIRLLPVDRLTGL